MASNSKKVVMVSSQFYLPGFKAGGALRSVVNIIAQLNRFIDFKVITSDTDAFTITPFENIKAESWQVQNGAEVFYVSSNKLNFSYWQKLLNSSNYDVLYLNSFFSPRFSFFPLLLARTSLIKNSNIILAPRGELAESALGIKPTKKYLYILFAKAIGLFSHVTFQASTIYEKKDIVKVFGSSVKIVVAEDLPAKVQCGEINYKLKVINEARFVYLGRIARVKNIHSAIEALSQLSNKCEYNIYGPIDDENYWRQCEKLIAKLPDHISVNYLGEISNDKIAGIFSVNDFLLLPSLGENYCHVIYESLAHHCPVVISDRTPWRELHANGVGWDLNITMPGQIGAVLTECCKMDQKSHIQMRKNCQKFIDNYLLRIQSIKDNLAMFERYH